LIFAKRPSNARRRSARLDRFTNGFIMKAYKLAKITMTCWRSERSTSEETSNAS
jgi:hypothetical protein